MKNIITRSNKISKRIGKNFAELVTGTLFTISAAFSIASIPFKRHCAGPLLPNKSLKKFDLLNSCLI